MAKRNKLYQALATPTTLVSEINLLRFVDNKKNIENYKKNLKKVFTVSSIIT